MNKILNAIMLFITRRVVKKYKHYPKDSTAVLFIDCQSAFLENKPELKNKLLTLKELAKECQWKVIYTKYRPTPRKYPTPIHDFLNKEYITGTDELFPKQTSNDLVIHSRGTISAFAETNLSQILQEQGIEHLILAGPFADLTIDSTMRDGVQQDYHITIAHDCVLMSKPNLDFSIYKLTIQRYAHELLKLGQLRKIGRSTMSN